MEDVLPAEMWQHIFHFLKVKQLVPVRLCCASWRVLADDDVCWQHRVEQKFGPQDSPPEGWLALYKSLWPGKWHFQDVTKPGAVAELTDKKRVFKSKSGGPVVARSKEKIQLKDKNVHLFQIKVVQVGPLCILGLADHRFSEKNSIYTSDNSGIAWYSSGCIYSGGSTICRDHNFKDGDIIELAVDMARKQVAFYKKGVMIGDIIEVPWLSQDLFLSCLIFDNSSIELVKHRIQQSIPSSLM